MNVMLKSVISALAITLIVSCELNPYVIDIDKGELYREKDGKPEIIPCRSEKALPISCFDKTDQKKIRKCFNRLSKKAG